ncbi:MAG TPA: hypothetical protein VK576_03060, partial [Thermoleophilia bacterium]|nr:hypothetical protein [Thermoleophilia bacterium]
MRRLPVLVLLVTVACGLAVSAVPPQPANALGYVDLQVKQNVLPLRGYINGQGASHGFVYPTKSQVKKGGGLAAPVWPLNPWTGKPMSSGSGRGCYTYTPAAGRHSYKLVAHFSKGSYTVSGGSPAWLATERTKAASDLKAADDALGATRADLATARDTEAELGGRVIKGYIDKWGIEHNGTAPDVSLIT